MHVRVSRTRPDRLHHLRETLRSGVDSLTAAGRCYRRHHVGLGERAGDGRWVSRRANRRCRYSRRRSNRRHQRLIGVVAQPKHDAPGEPWPPEVNVRLGYLGGEILPSLLIRDQGAVFADGGLEFTARFRLDGRRRLIQAAKPGGNRVSVFVRGHQSHHHHQERHTDSPSNPGSRIHRRLSFGRSLRSANVSWNSHSGFPPGRQSCPPSPSLAAQGYSAAIWLERLFPISPHVKSHSCHFLVKRGRLDCSQ